MQHFTRRPDGPPANTPASTEAASPQQLAAATALRALFGAAAASLAVRAQLDPERTAGSPTWQASDLIVWDAGGARLAPEHLPLRALRLERRGGVIHTRRFRIPVEGEAAYLGCVTGEDAIATGLTRMLARAGRPTTLWTALAELLNAEVGRPGWHACHLTPASSPDA